MLCGAKFSVKHTAALLQDRQHERRLTVDGHEYAEVRWPVCYAGVMVWGDGRDGYMGGQVGESAHEPRVCGGESTRLQCSFDSVVMVGVVRWVVRENADDWM